MKKRFYIFAGVNGAGKTTLYNMDIIKKLDTGKRINTDEIVKIIGDWKSAKDQMTAGRLAIHMKDECIKNGETFNQETTLTGKRIIKTIDILKEQGYEINLYYVGVDSPEIAKRRVKDRVLLGGHDIPEEKIEKRYKESLDNLKKIISKCDNILFYDNSILYEKCVSKRNGKVEVYENKAVWAKEIIPLFFNEI